ncbi:hypothetical protein LTR70_009393 [Exophiala xenobiotica]|nr:hypothetical protein LTR70_009393 [Exophiala xenobiotica]
MAEALAVVAVVASLAQLTDFSLRLAYKGSTVSKQIKCAPKILALVSNEVALTGTTLHHLSNEITNAKYHEVLDPEALSKIDALTKGCKEIFRALEDILTATIQSEELNKEKIYRRFAFRIKLRKTIDELTEKRDCLCRIKNDLMLMMQILVLAYHRRHLANSQQARDTIINDHSLLIQMAQNVRNSQSILSELQDRRVTEIDCPNNGIESRLNVGCEEHPHRSKDVHWSLPLEVKLSAHEIKEHARLVSDLLSTIQNVSYGITTKIRSRMYRHALSEHVASWERLAQRYGTDKLVPLFAQHHDLSRYWQSKYRKETSLALRTNNSIDDTNKHCLSIANRTWKAQGVDPPENQPRVNVVRVVASPRPDRFPFVHECNMMQRMPTATGTGKTSARSQVAAALERFTSLTRDELEMFGE